MLSKIYLELAKYFVTKYILSTHNSKHPCCKIEFRTKAYKEMVEKEKEFDKALAEGAIEITNQQDVDLGINRKVMIK